MTYRVQVCGEYVYANLNTRTIYTLAAAKLCAKSYLKAEEKSSISIHAFDRNESFSHFINW